MVEVTETGPASAMGRIAALMDTRLQATPLQLRMADSAACWRSSPSRSSATVMVLGLLRGEPTEMMVVTAISLAVAAVPESLASRRDPQPRAGRTPDGSTQRYRSTLAGRRNARLHHRHRHGQDGNPHPRSHGGPGGLDASSLGGLLRGGLRAWGQSVAGHSSRGSDSAPDLVELLTAGALCNDAALVPPARPRIHGRGWVTLPRSLC